MASESYSISVRKVFFFLKIIVGLYMVHINLEGRKYLVVFLFPLLIEP